MARLRLDQLEIEVLPVDSSESLGPLQHKNCYTFPSTTLISDLLQRINTLGGQVKKLRENPTNKPKRKKRAQ